MSIRKHMEVAIEAAKLAGAFLLDQTQAGKIAVHEKHNNDFVTDSDSASERMIIAHLKTAFPDEQVFGEESGSDGTGSNGRWIIDPIDGTTNFFRGMPNFTISIAWELEPHKPLVGVVFNPTQGEMFYAGKGLGAWCNGKPIHASVISDPKKAIVVCVPPHRHHEATVEYFAIMQRIFLNTSDLRSFGSAALELCYIACGRLDGYFERFLGYYDIAGGMAILQEAGGIVEPVAVENPLTDTRCDVIASNSLLQDWLHEVISAQ